MYIQKACWQSACCCVGGQGLGAEDSTRAFAEGSPLIAAPAASETSDYSRQAVVQHAPASIEYDIEVDELV